MSLSLKALIIVVALYSVHRRCKAVPRKDLNVLTSSGSKIIRFTPKENKVIFKFKIPTVLKLWNYNKVCWGFVCFFSAVVIFKIKSLANVIGGLDWNSTHYQAWLLSSFPRTNMVKGDDQQVLLAGCLLNIMCVCTKIHTCMQTK